MIVHARLSAIKGIKAHEWIIRFVFGGIVCVIAGLIAQHFGPVIGGFFLAFPAIFPASATLIAKREREKKASKGLDGTLRGQRAAALDGAGAVLGAIALACFAWLVWKQLPAHESVSVLGVASTLWATVAVVLWWGRKRLGVCRARLRHFRPTGER